MDLVKTLLQTIDWERSRANKANRIQNNKNKQQREASRAENTRNRNAKLTSLIGLKGVRLTTSNKYEANIKLNGQFKYLGTFDTPKEAATAYANAAKEAYGEFARHDQYRGETKAMMIEFDYGERKTYIKPPLIREQLTKRRFWFNKIEFYVRLGILYIRPF